ncbi:Invertase 2 [Venturia nashicola]|uniref:Invertase 2 n=1 Tax=Venturia nashicola TaxID=86259 RepID=A0A4Z1PH34_9PEZI|nr:Invertase 2 [Venturia nashicola]
MANRREAIDGPHGSLPGKTLSKIRKLTPSTEDSPMQDESPSMSDGELDLPPQTPHRPSANQLSSELSPPNSQSRPAESSIPANTANKMSTSASINANGKRKWATNGESASSNVTQGVALAQAQTGGSTAMIIDKDPNSGYTWTREEDAPGHSWNNQKAKDEASREFSRFVDKDRMIKNKYGDVLGK